MVLSGALLQGLSHWIFTQCSAQDLLPLSCAYLSLLDQDRGDGELTFTCPLPASSETWQRRGNPLLPEGKQSLGTALQEQEFHVLRRFSSSSANRVLSGLCCGEFPRGSAPVIAEITTSLVRSSRGCLGGVLHGGCQGCLEAFESHGTPLAGHLCCPSWAGGQTNSSPLFGNSTFPPLPHLWCAEEFEQRHWFRGGSWGELLALKSNQSSTYWEKHGSRST